MTTQDHELFGKFVQVARLLHRHRHHCFRDHGPMGDPHRGQGRVLALLRMRPEISQRDLGYLLDMRTQSLGELLAKLERGGYISRTPSEADRRAMDIRLTEAGMAEAGKERPMAEEGALFGDLDAEDQARLGEYLDRVIAAMERRLGDEPGQDPGDERAAFGPFGHHGRGHGRGCHGRHHGHGDPHGHGHHHDHGHGDESAFGEEEGRPGGGRGCCRGHGREDGDDDSRDDMDREGRGRGRHGGFDEEGHGPRGRGRRGFHDGGY